MFTNWQKSYQSQTRQDTKKTRPSIEYVHQQYKSMKAKFLISNFNVPWTVTNFLMVVPKALAEGKGGTARLFHFIRRLPLHHKTSYTTSVLDLSSPNCTGHLFLLFFFRFSFFLWIKLGLFLLFPFAFVFFPLITHICFSLFENDGNESTSRRQGRNREASSFYPQITPMK